MGPGGRGVKGCRGAHLWGAWTCPIGPGGLAWNVGEVGPSLPTMSMLTKILQGLAVVVVGMSLESATAVARDLSAFPERALDEAVAEVLAWPLAIAGEALVLGALGTDSDDGVRAAARTSLRDRLARVGAHA